MPKHAQTDTNPRAAAGISRVLILGCTIYTAVVLAGIAVLMNVPALYGRLGAESYAQLHATTRQHAIAFVVLVAAMLLLRRRKVIRPLVAKCLLPIALLFLLASVDRLVGVAYPPPLEQNTIFQPDEARGWTNIPNAHATMEVEILLDEHGLRVNELAPQTHRTDGRIRIMFLGDSITFGFCHHARDTYEARAAAILNRENPKLDLVALNAGTIGYDTWQEWHYFEHEGERLKPDALVLQFCLNDAAAMYDPRIGPDMDRHPQASQIAQPTHWSGIHRAIVAWAAHRKFGENLQQGAQALEHFQMEELLQPTLGERARHAMELVTNHLDKLANRCKQQGIRFIVVCFPMRSQLLDASLVPQPQRILRTFCEQHDVAYLDLLPAFQRAANREEGGVDSLYIDHVHPTTTGNAVAAHAFASFLQQSGILEELDRKAGGTATTSQNAQ